MKYGYFDDAKKEYVINTPKTPLPWINYLGNKDFFGLISNTSGGYCFYKDARMRRITRYRYNNVPADNGGRYFYINDGGDCWSPAFMPMKKELDSYECRHGLGYTKITGGRNNVVIEQTAFVPIDDTCEIHYVKVKNTGDSQKSIKLFSFVEFCLWDAHDDMTNFQRNLSTGEMEVIGSTIYHKTEYRERRNHYSFYTVNTDVAGFDTERDVFLGQFNGFETPDSVLKGTSGNTVAHGWYPVASHQIDVDIRPGEEKDYIFILGYAENENDKKWESKGIINKAPALRIMEKYKTTQDITDALAKLASFWENLLSKYQIKSGNEMLDRMVNIWNPYQCMVTFNMSRSASFYESGIGRGMGFRDSNQDLLGFVHQIPERARERIIDIASTQFEDGSAYHQYQPLTKKGNSDIGGGFNDDPLWLIAGTSAYIKESGDFGILDEQVPFDCNQNNTATLFEHLNRSFDHVINNLGPHKLPLIGRADWNDCLNLNCFSSEPGESFQTFGNPDGRVAESVFIAGMFILYGNEYVDLCEKRGLKDEADRARKHIKEMEEATLTSGWDGGWFVRAYDHFGNKVGSNECEEGKIFIEPQGMCIMAGVGKDDGKARQTLENVAKHLDTKYGIMLQQPAYSEYHLELGEISSYPPGYKENAGIFCHNNPWIMIAETVVGNGNRAFEVYSKIAPAFIEDISEIHRTEPYVYSQMIAGGDAFKPGEAKNSWLTGTAAWNYAAITQYILGIKPTLDGLLVDPCIPAEWDKYEITREFRGNKIDITILNPNHVCKGVKEIKVENGTENNGIINANGNGICKVTVVLG